MRKLIPILLISLYTPYVTGFLFDINIHRSGVVSSDKIFRLLVIYFSFIILIVQLKYSSLPRDFGKYLFLSVLYLMIYFAQNAFLVDNREMSFIEMKELYRLTALIILFLVCTMGSLNPIDFRFLVRGLVFVGLLVAVLSLRQSLISEISHVGEYMRSGTSVTDPNILGAFINMTSAAAILGYFMDEKWQYKILFLFSFIVMQTGRFFTFSTGSFLNIIITLLATFYLLNKYNKKYFKHFLIIMLSLVFLFVIAISSMGLFDTLFYRIKMSDESVKKSSIYSRLDQHAEYIDRIKQNPLIILYGSENAKLSGGSMYLHNTYLRPLVVGGILAFLSFNFLCLLCFRDFNSAIKSSEGNELLISIFFFSSFIGWSFQAATLPCDTSIMQWFFFILGYSLKNSVAYIEG